LIVPPVMSGESSSVPVESGAVRSTSCGRYCRSTERFHCADSESWSTPSTCSMAGWKPMRMARGEDLHDRVVSVRAADIRPQRLPEAVGEVLPTLGQVLDGREVVLAVRVPQPHRRERMVAPIDMYSAMPSTSHPGRVVSPCMPPPRRDCAMLYWNACTISWPSTWSVSRYDPSAA
jgi:hypothetical protein